MLEGQAEQYRANITVQFSTNKYEAYFLLKQDPGGRILDNEYLIDVIKKNGINTGIDKQALDKILVQPQFNVSIPVATGKQTVPGEDAEVKFMFEMHRDLTPKVKEDGTVDFKNFGAIQTVKAGAVLAVKKPKTDGIAGINVCGQPLPLKQGRDYPIPAGRNVVFSPDKLTLMAEVDGQAVYHNDRVSVLNTYVVEGDVSVASGNIDFNGNVQVKGSVQSGFKVVAAGNVEVFGVVEAAEIEAGGDIIIQNGFNGGDKGILNAGGSIVTKFVQGGSVSLGGKLETTYIYNSNIRSRDRINVIGKGIVIGGYIAARTKIEAGTLGNESNTKTIVEVGSDPETLKRNQELIQELENCNKNIKALDSAVNMLGQLKAAGKLPPEKEEQFRKSQVMIYKLEETKAALDIEKAAIDEKLAQFGKGIVSVRNIAHAGVVIVMGSEQMPIKSKYHRTTFSRPEGYIKSGPL